MKNSCLEIQLKENDVHRLNYPTINVLYKKITNKSGGKYWICADGVR